MVSPFNLSILTGASRLSDFVAGRDLIVIGLLILGVATTRPRLKAASSLVLFSHFRGESGDWSGGPVL